ncbi:MAG: hypothetical protein ACI4EN_00300 [Butyrivibrio sp.]
MSTGLGEFWDQWDRENKEFEERHKKRLAELKEKAEKDRKEQKAAELEDLKELQSRYNFKLEGDVLTAIQRLESLAVNKYRYNEFCYQDSFNKVYSSVRHEVDLYEEGDESPLNKNSCRGAKNWLDKWRHLYNSY